MFNEGSASSLTQGAAAHPPRPSEMLLLRDGRGRWVPADELLAVTRHLGLEPREEPVGRRVGAVLPPRALRSPPAPRPSRARPLPPPRGRAQPSRFRPQASP